MLWQQFVQRPKHLTNNPTVSLNIVFSLMCPCRILHAPGQRLIFIAIRPRSLGVPGEIESQTAEADGIIHRFE
jgi:hypothetical protein